MGGLLAVVESGEFGFVGDCSQFPELGLDPPPDKNPESLLLLGVDME